MYGWRGSHDGSRPHADPGGATHVSLYYLLSWRLLIDRLPSDYSAEMTIKDAVGQYQGRLIRALLLIEMASLLPC